MAGRATHSRILPFVIAAVGLALAAVMVGAGLTLHQTIAEARRLIILGQAQVLLSDVREAMRPEDDAPRGTPPELDADLLEETGVTYVALLNADNEVLRELGEPKLTSMPDRDPQSFHVVKGHARVVRPVVERPPFRRRPPCDPALEDCSRRRRRARPPRRPGSVLIEFEPELANELNTRGDAVLYTSIIAAVALLLGSLGLAWTVRQRDIAQHALGEQKTLAALGEMSAVMAHELRNPLASAKGNAELLVEVAEEGSRQRRRAQRVLSELQRLHALTDGLLAFVRSGRLERRPTDVVALVTATAHQTAPDRVEVAAVPADIEWPLDEGRIRQVMSNLLDNAVRAAPDQPIEVAIHASKRELTIAVRDHGDGITPGRTEEIFTPFVTDRLHGTGLGLAIARQIAEAHGGALTADNHPDGGAIFTLTLPATA